MSVWERLGIAPVVNRQGVGHAAVPLDAHAALDETTSYRLYARLSLLLANALGDVERARAVIHAARGGVDTDGTVGGAAG